MRLRIGFLILALALISLPQAATASTSVGSKCSQPGNVKQVSGKKLVCVKANGKLQWRPKPVKKPISATDQSTKLIDVFGNPTSAEAKLIDQFTETAWAKGKPASNWLVSEVHPKVAGKRWAEDATAIMPAITQILDGIGTPITRELEWFVWWDLASLRPKLPNNCWAKFDDAFDQNSVGAGYCIPSTIFIFYDAYQQWYAKDGFLERYPNQWDKYGLIGVAAGEVTHFAQQIYGEKYNHESFQFYPAWLREGPTILYSAMAYAKYANLPYSTVRNLALQHFNNPNCANIPMTDLLMTNQSPSLCEYSGGFLASEYLVAKTGDILAPFRYLESKMPGNGEYCPAHRGICRSSYEQVIAEIYSKDVAAWHADIHKYVRAWSK
jgi:hypothetical protein